MDNLIFENGGRSDILAGKRAVMLVVPFSNYNDQCKTIVNKFLTNPNILRGLVKEVLIPNDIFTVYICLVNVDFDYSSNSRRLITNEVYSKTNFIINTVGVIVGDAYRNANFVPIISGEYFLTMKSISKMVTSNSIFTVPRRKAIKINKGDQMIDKEVLNKCREYMKSFLCIAISDFDFYNNKTDNTETIIEKTLMDVAVAAFIPLNNTGIIIPR